MSSTLSQQMGRITRQLSLILQGHILNWPWKSRLERRRTRYLATRNSTLSYLKRYLPFISAVKPLDLPEDKEPERVFTIWFQGEKNAPGIVKSCIKSMKRHLKQEVVVIDESNIFQWVNIPEYIVKKWKDGKLKDAHFCDICRVDLLYRHGGFWLDATAFVTSSIPEWIVKEDFFMFMSGDKIRGSYSFVQNCFIRSKKANPLISMWREVMLNYWQKEDSIVNYFTHQLLFMLLVNNNDYAAKIFSNYPKVVQDPTHTLWDAHKLEPYVAEEFQALIKDSFFQKTEYKSEGSRNPVPDSYADIIINHADNLYNNIGN